MATTLKSYLFKTLGVQEGEIGKMLLMQVNIFLIICASLIVKPIANGLFLAKFGIEQLPIAFVLVAVVAGLVSYLYTQVLQRFSVLHIFRLTFVVSIVFLLVIGLLLHFNILEGVVLYLLYIWIAIFALIAASQFWIIANVAFNAREAKRLFGLLGAGAISGAIFGGYLTSILANFLNSEYLLFLCAILLLICIPITGTVWRRYVVRVRSEIEQNKRPEFVSSHPFLLIRRSRHLSYMAAIAFVGVLVAKLVDYQFGGLAVEAIEDPDELTAFFGFWFSTFNVISLLLQLVVTRRVVGTFGVGSSLFFLPGFILLAATMLLVFPELLMAAVFLKMTDASLKQSVNKAAMELLILPIPTQIKNQTKTFIDVVVDCIATGCSGLLLIFVIQGLDLPSIVVTIMILLFGVLWFQLAFRVRREYVNTFSRRIEEAIGLQSRKSKDPFDFTRASVLDGLRKVLREGTELQILFILRKLRELKEGRVYQDVARLLDHPRERIVAEALRYLIIFRRNPKEIRERIEPLMHTGGQEVKVEAFEYLVRFDYEQREMIMQKYLGDPDYRVRIAAMVSLARESRTNPELKDAFHLEELIRERYTRLSTVADPEEHKVRLQGILLAMGFSRIPEFYPVLSSYFSHADPEISSQAFIAAGKTASEVFVPELVAALGMDRTKSVAIEALTQYGSGVVTALRRYAEDPELPLQIIKALPVVAAAMPSRETVEFCFELLAHESADVRQEAIQALNTLKQDYADYKVDRRKTINEIRREARLYQDTLSILYAQIQTRSTEERHGENEAVLKSRQKLIDLLEAKLDADLQILFQLLGLHYATQKMESVYKVLRGDAHETRTDALEFLDNLMEPNLKKVLMPIIEAVAWESISEEAIRKMKIRIPNEFQCFQMILTGNNRKLKLAVLQLIRLAQKKEYSTLIETALIDADPKVQEQAQQIHAKNLSHV